MSKRNIAEEDWLVDLVMSHTSVHALVHALVVVQNHDAYLLLRYVASYLLNLPPIQSEFRFVSQSASSRALGAD